MKEIDEFVDSSDDEDIVEKNPYPGISDVSEVIIRTDLTLSRIKDLSSSLDAIAAKPSQTVQYLLKNSIEKKKKPGAQRKTALLSKPLMEVKQISNVVPSNISKQHLSTNSVLPAYRGISNSSEKGEKLFFLTQFDFLNQNLFSSLAYKMSKLEPSEINKASFYTQADLKMYKKIYKLPRKPLEKKRNQYIQDLTLHAKQVKDFFNSTLPIVMTFNEWETVFPNIRKPKILYEKDPKTGAVYLLTLKEILSYVYTSNYKQFLEIFSNFPEHMQCLKQLLNARPRNKKHFKNEMIALEQAYQLLPKDDLAQSIPFLSEGQIPRHALLYAFDVKKYENMTVNAEVKPYYQQNLKPTRAYLGKFFISQNPHQLFNCPDKPLSVVEFDKQYEQKLIEKTIIGEKEIQHVGANLQGKIAKAINIKLPKFDKEYPPHYMQKYGLSLATFQAFKTMFQTLSHGNYGKLSWMYLEALLFAHLIHFHELQIYKFTGKIAENLGKELLCCDRDGQEIDNPYAQP